MSLEWVERRKTFRQNYRKEQANGRQEPQHD